jgi:hypothetical protein
MPSLLKKLFAKSSASTGGLQTPSPEISAYMDALKARRNAKDAIVVVRTHGRDREGYLAWLDGAYERFLNDKLHCDGAPALQSHDGTKMWFRHGVLHNDNGPAIERPDGSAECWKNGEPVEMILAPARPAGPTPAEKALADTLEKIQCGAAQPVPVSAPLRLKKPLNP